MSTTIPIVVCIHVWTSSFFLFLVPVAETRRRLSVCDLERRAKPKLPAGSFGPPPRSTWILPQPATWWRVGPSDLALTCAQRESELCHRARIFERPSEKCSGLRRVRGPSISAGSEGERGPRSVADYLSLATIHVACLTTGRGHGVARHVTRWRA